MATADEPDSPDTDEPEEEEELSARELRRRKHTPKRPRGPQKQEDIDRRRDLVAALWVEGYTISEISRIVNEQRPAGTQPWDRMTFHRDVKKLRASWEKEGRRTAESRKAELERMCRNIYKKALRVERPVVMRTKSDAGEVVRTEMVPAPDLAAANRAVERMGALYGLNVTTLDGSLGLSGLADLLGAASEDEEGEA